MKVYVLTIHNPAISMGPNIRLQCFLKTAKDSGIEYILPNFSTKKSHSKAQTLKILISSFFYLFKNRKKIDMVHVVTPPSYPGLIAVLMKKFFHLPYVVDIGDPCAENMALIKDLSEKSIKFTILKRIDNTLYDNASHLILTSPELTKYIPSQIPHSTILTGTKPLENIVPHPLPNNKKCLYIGQYGPLQNIKYIIEIFEKAIEHDPSIQLHIIGQGDKLKLKSEKNIRFLNPVSETEIENLLPKYTCGIVSLDLNPALNYAIPTKLLTYLSNGLPVFGTGGKAVKEIVKQAGAGYISTKYDIETDSSQLLHLLSNQEKLKNYAENAISFAKDNLTLENCGQKASKIYKIHLH